IGRTRGGRPIGQGVPSLGSAPPRGRRPAQPAVLQLSGLEARLVVSGHRAAASSVLLPLQRTYFRGLRGPARVGLAPAGRPQRVSPAPTRGDGGVDSSFRLDRSISARSTRRARRVIDSAATSAGDSHDIDGIPASARAPVHGARRTSGTAERALARIERLVSTLPPSRSDSGAYAAVLALRPESGQQPVPD